MKLDEITNKRKMANGINPNDEFYTPEYAITPLLKYLSPNSNIWCPFDTAQSNFVKLLTANGHKVYNSHINDNRDFFSANVPEHIDYIISNPPYSLKTKVFDRLFDIGIPFAMLVGVVGIFESQERFSMFKNHSFEIMYFNKRISYFRDYNSQTPDLNPPFSSVYITSGVLPERIVFETINKQNQWQQKTTN